MVKWNKKCKKFNGKYACDTLRQEGYKSCEGCRFPEEFSKKILIIKLGAMGDVLRSTCLLSSIIRKYGEDSMLYWLTNPESVELLEDNECIDCVLEYNQENLMRLEEERFDVVYNLEYTTPGTLVMNKIKADEKYGWGFGKDGHAFSLNPEAENYLDTAYSDYFKKENKKTYQELMGEALKLDYNNEDDYLLYLSKESIDYGEKFKKENNLPDDIIGVNVGAGGRWKSKNWSKEEIIKLVERLKENEKEVLLLGGPNEIGLIDELKFKLNRKEIKIVSNNPNNSIKEFIGVVNLCSVLVSGDSLALHIGLALRKKVVGLFFSTPDWEVEGFGRLEKIRSNLFDKYFFEDGESEELAGSIKADDVLRRIG